MKILGISCFYHDSAVAAVEDGEIKFALQEERLSRVKHDARFPIMALSKALEVCQWPINTIDEIAFYENPNAKLQRIFDQIISDWPKSWLTFRDSIPNFYRFKYPIETIIRNKLRYRGKISCGEHHRSHAASAFFTSPFDEALVVTLDGVGEHETTAVYLGRGNTLTKLAAIHFPDSLGLLYSVFTQYLGFEVNEGEYKVMGLAPYGKPELVDRILNKMIFFSDDGSFHLDDSYFDFSNHDRHYSQRFKREIGIPPRTSNEPVLKIHENLAASIQVVLEKAIINILKPFVDRYGIKNVCMAGGVALNCTANAELIRNLGIRLHVHPAAGDAGGALGAALNEAIKTISEPCYRFQFQPYLGAEYSSLAIEAMLRINETKFVNTQNIASEIAKKLADGNVVAIFQGRDEWGPRALGNRSILANPRTAGMKDHLNAKIKFREEFRPFAPVVMSRFYSQYFEGLNMSESPHMLFTHRALMPTEIPAVVHVDGTSRVQTVSPEQNRYLHAILQRFYELTGIPVLVNTSFNLRGEPIVCSPSDALKTFSESEIDFLAIENYWVSRHDLPNLGPHPSPVSARLERNGSEVSRLK